MSTPPHTTRSRTLALAGLVVTGLVLGLLFAQLGRGVGANENPGNDPEKQAILDRVAREQAEAHARVPDHPKPGNPAAERPAPSDEAGPALGIIPVSVPFGSDEYVIEAEGWQSVSGNQRVTAYPGALASDRTQGVVVIAVATRLSERGAPNFTDELAADEEVRLAAYTTPRRAGSVRVTAASGNLLTLTAADGSRFVFNVASRRFVAS